MKTKTTNPTKMGGSTNSRNFFLKTFILLAILAFMGLAPKTYSQIQFDFTVNNQSNCTFNIRAFDSGGNPLGTASLTSIPPGLSNSGCITSGLVTVNRIDIIRAGCTTESFFATTTTSGVITYSTISPPSSCTPSCSVTMTCAGSGGGTHCGGTNDFHYLIEIF